MHLLSDTWDTRGTRDTRTPGRSSGPTLTDPPDEPLEDPLDDPLDLAVDCALRGPRGANPLVGAVITGPDGAVVATGWHRGRGTAHAEVDALVAHRRVDDAPPLRDCTLHVTLEPCDHTGRTGPCSRAILEAGLRSVRFAVADRTGPDDGGAARLHAAGIEVVQQSGPAAEALNRRWFAAREAGRPFVTGHLAQSLDGRVAAADGTSQWITGTASRAHAHRVRARVDAMIVGTGTVLRDDPRLTARTAEGTELPDQPVPVVQGRRAVPERARLRRERWLQVPSHRPQDVLEALTGHPGPWPHGSRAGHVLIEGGPAVLSAWLAADLIDELFLYQAPLVIGEGPTGLHGIGAHTLDEARHLSLDDAETGGISRLGEDVLLHLTP